MKKFELAIIALSLTTGATLALAQPTPQFSAGQPGLRLPFANNGNPDVWGDLIFQGGYTWDTFSGTATTTAAIARYGPTLDNAGDTSNGATNITPMSQLEDWVLSFSLSHTGAEFVDYSLLARANEGTANEQNVLVLRNDGAGNYSITGGSATLASLGQLDTGSEFFHDIVVHFDADGLGGGTYDTYLDGTQVGFDAVSTVTDHGIDFISLQAKEGSVDKWRVIYLGQIPEPATASLIGLAALMFTMRRTR